MNLNPKADIKRQVKMPLTNASSSHKIYAEILNSNFTKHTKKFRIHLASTKKKKRHKNLCVISNLEVSKVQIKRIEKKN